MSRLIKKLNCVRQPEPQPMGFRLNAVCAEKSRMRVIASLKADLIEKVTDRMNSGDGILVLASSAPEIKAAEKLCQEKDGLPAGRWLRDNSEKAVQKVLESICDFVVFNSTAPVNVTRNEKIGRILELDMNLGEGLLRAAGDLPVDAVMASYPNQETSITIQSLMLIQRLASLVSKPILITVPGGIGVDELQSLWDIGICGVVVEINDEKSAESLSEIRQKIEKLNPPAFRKKGKTTAILPPSRAETSVPEEDEGEEEEDE